VEKKAPSISIASTSEHIPEGKKPLVRSSCKWENTIKMDLEEIRW